MSAKSDILKQINTKVKRKRDIALELSREKTVAHWVCEFFDEIEKTKSIDQSGAFATIALSKLINNLRSIDRLVTAIYKQPTDSEPKVEIHWSKNYISGQNCEEVTVLDASSALFQEALEKL